MRPIKAVVSDSNAHSWTFRAQKTMYGSKRISKGEEIFIFASENEGGSGLIASGAVSSAEATPRKVGIERHTPCVSITVKRTGQAKRRLGRIELESFSEWTDGRPETELNFKFCRQATNRSSASQKAQLHSYAASFSKARPYALHVASAGPHISGELMFDHVLFGVSDYAASKAFFLRALEPLGVAVVQEGPLGVELSSDDKSSLCICQTEEKPAHLHLAFTAENRQQVEAFYRAALEAGGKDNGAPGLRPHYHANYYAAFVIGPDGHNIEVVCHDPEV